MSARTKTKDAASPDERRPHAVRSVVVGALAPDLRCGCGRLLARVTEGGLELRCARCKTAHVLPWADVEGAADLFEGRFPGRLAT